MARICGVCRRAPREGEELRPIRLTAQEDMDARGVAVTELGLYAACEECVSDHRQRLGGRTGVHPDQIPAWDMC